MPNFKEKVAEFLRQISDKSGRLEDKSPVTSPTTGTFIYKYLTGEVKKNQPDIIFGKSCYDLPVKEIECLSPKVSAAYTGPNGGLTQVNRAQKAFCSLDADVDFIDEDCTDNAMEESLKEVNQNKLSPKSSTCNVFPAEDEEIAGVQNWNRPGPDAYGMATTLYECHPITRENAGEPIADAFVVCARQNSAILALADGVNWGEKSCLAARCAVHGCVDYLNKALYREGGHIETTLDVYVCLLRSFHAAHNLILQENGLLTTLCAAVACQLRDSDQFVVCTCNVGDSLAYVYSTKHGVREITQGSHDIHSMRDMRDALGALGPVDGQNPELNNLTVAMTVADPGDIIFLTSDGISDNFDPVVGKFALPKKQERESPDQPEPFMPFVEAHQRHELTLLRMDDLLRHGVHEGDGPCESAQALCEQLIDFATKLTVAKRRILEDPDLYREGDQGAVAQVDQRVRRRKVGEKLAMVPGKLDHASVVAFTVPQILCSSPQNYESRV